MSGTRQPSRDPHDWLEAARSAMAMARARTPGVLPEDRCFQAQQAAEKAIKAVFIARQIDFPYTHDLSRLVNLFATMLGEPPAALVNARVLTPYAVATRYPFLDEPITPDELAEALDLAAAAVAWAEGYLAAHWSPRDS